MKRLNRKFMKTLFLKLKVSCALGLLNVQIYYGLRPKDLVLGEIKDPTSGEAIH